MEGGGAARWGGHRRKEVAATPAAARPVGGFTPEVHSTPFGSQRRKLI